MRGRNMMGEEPIYLELADDQSGLDDKKDQHGVTKKQPLTLGEIVNATVGSVGV